MSKPATKLHPAITAQLRAARIRGGQIEAVAYHLARLMEEVHGADWQYHISHEANAEFVLIRRDPRKEGCR